MEEANESGLPPSVLGTKQHWDDAYDREIKFFQENGALGDIWFGEDIQERLVDWLDENEDISKDDTILDIGCGNGALLLELRQRGFTNLTGVDYAPVALDLSREVLAKEGITDVRLQTGDMTADVCSLPEACCLRERYGVCFDKGTYDAISLMPEGAKEGQEAYRRSVKRLLNPDGVFIITSCNWTKEELLNFFQTDFKQVGEIPTPSFQFGGKVGRTVTILIFSHADQSSQEK